MLIRIPHPDIGANPSAEEADEGLDEGTKQVIDVVDAFRLNSLGAFNTKKAYVAQLKSTHITLHVDVGCKN